MFYNDFYNTSTVDTVAVLSVCRSLMNKLLSKQNACAILTCRRNCDTLEQRHVGTAAYWHAPYWKFLHCGMEASVISDLMSWAACYNSFTLSQSAISNEGCSQDTLSIVAALHL